jgi:ribonuclease P protein component
VNPASAPFLLGERPKIQGLNRPEDFQRAMAGPWLSKTPHFALHHLREPASRLSRGAPGTGLSSGAAADSHGPVDNSLENPVDKSLEKAVQAPSAAACGATEPQQTPRMAVWAGYVVPKRHARRAVTRNLIRRQMRQVLADQHSTAHGLPAGIWVLRLRQGFDRAQFPSAASAPLKQAVRDELQRLVGHAMARHTERGARP